MATTKAEQNRRIKALQEQAEQVAKKRGVLPEDILQAWLDDHTSGAERAAESRDLTQAALDRVTKAK